ncbi:hypothetical protein ACWD5R_11460 [Streptomyces sp. NPDC002514]|uniref:hypothetical protein n=1 Tax=Streptomyces sp. NPDC001270 TaxID=3364554 RepID=UPI0036C9809B
MAGSQRLRFILDGDDRLSRVLNNAGDSSVRLHRRLNDDMDGNSRAVARFTQDANGRLHDLRGRFVAVADASRLMAGGMPDVTRQLDDVTGAGSGAAASLGQSGGGLGGVMLGVAAAAGLSLLPALGALVPALAGAGLAAGTLKMGVSGVGDALEAQAKGQKEYADALKKLSPPARDFTKSLVGLKKEFGPIGKEIQAAMLPGFTQAVKAAGPVVTILGRAMTDMGSAFGDAAEGVGRLLRDSGFQSDLQTNLKLGTGFIKDMTGALGPFTRSLLDLGAASGPTLKALSDGIGGLLATGLPAMFDGLKAGIPGTAAMLNGLFSAVNDTLGGLGRLAGEFGRTLGPVFGQQFQLGGSLIAGAMDTVRGAVVLLRPVIQDIGYGFKAILDVGRIIGPTLADTGSAILGAFAPIGASVNQAIGPLQTLDLWVNNNRASILEAARIFGNGMIDITQAAAQAAPFVVRAFGMISRSILDAIDIAVSVPAKMFGFLPGIGDKLKAANRQFDQFKDGYIATLGAAESKAGDFAASATKNLAPRQLQMNIANWNAQIDAAKAKLKTVPASKQAALKATIKDLQDKIASARAQLNALNGKTATTYVQTVRLGGSGPYRGKEVPAGATGGLFTGSTFRHRGYASGGLVDGPGTETSDSVFAPWLSKNEFVVNAASTRQYLPLLRAINSGTLGTGSLGAAGLDVGKGLVKGIDASAAGVGESSRRMAAAVTQGVRDELEIASPSKKMQALAKDIGAGLIKGLTGSRDKIQATAKDLATDIRTAFSGKKESGLLAMVDRQSKKLQDYAAQRDAFARRIAEAKEYTSGLTTNARSAAGLSNLGMSPEEVTAGGIKSGLQQKLSQIKTFSSYISTLAKRGLNKGLLRQILDMGPVDGYAYASALAGADKATLASVNNAQKQIDIQTSALGHKGGDLMYDAGKQAGKGFLTGLQAQQKDIEKLMTSIAKGMEKSIKKALGIKSPSRVMAQVGAYSTQGLAQGLVDGVPVLDRALDAVSGRVAATRPVLGRPAVTAGGGSTTVNLTVQAGIGTDPVALKRELRRMLLELKRDYGGNVALGVG